MVHEDRRQKSRDLLRLDVGKHRDHGPGDLRGRSERPGRDVPDDARAEKHAHGDLHGGDGREVLRTGKFDPQWSAAPADGRGDELPAGAPFPDPARGRVRLARLGKKCRGRDFGLV